MGGEGGNPSSFASSSNGMMGSSSGNLSSMADECSQLYSASLYQAAAYSAAAAAMLQQHHCSPSTPDMPHFNEPRGNWYNGPNNLDNLVFPFHSSANLMMAPPPPMSAPPKAFRPIPSPTHFSPYHHPPNTGGKTTAFLNPPLLDCTTNTHRGPNLAAFHQAHEQRTTQHEQDGQSQTDPKALLSA